MTTAKVGPVGTGVPTTATQTVTNLNGIPLNNTTVPKAPEDFFFAHLNGAGTAPDTLYIADYGTFASGTLSKWSLVAGTWTLNGTITLSATAGNANPPAALYYLSGSVTGGNVTLYATYGNGGSGITGPGFLYSITDTAGYNATFITTMSNLLATAGNSQTSNEIFRAVAVVPQAATQPRRRLWRPPPRLRTSVRAPPSKIRSRPGQCFVPDLNFRELYSSNTICNSELDT